jgi:hypothetical protein
LSSCFGTLPHTRYDRVPFSKGHVVRKLGCLELGFATEAVGRRTLLDVDVRNTCIEPTLVDLNQLRIEAEHEGGARRPAYLADPRGEIWPMHVDSFAEGTERIAVDEASGARRRCLDISKVSAVAPTEPTVCLTVASAGVP